MFGELLSVPGVKVMMASPLPAVIESMVGAPSAVGVNTGVTDTLLEAAFSPASFTAISDIKYSVSLVSPVIVLGLVSPVAGTVTTLASLIFDTLFDLALAV